jgi:hypothetical protein
MDGQFAWMRLLEPLQKGSYVEVPGLGRIQVARGFPSHNRQVFVGTASDGTERVIKTFNFGGISISLDYVSSVQSQIQQYREYLRRAEVPVVKDIGFTTYTIDDTTCLIQWESYTGLSLPTAIREFRLEASGKLVMAVCDRLIRPLFLNASYETNKSLVVTGLDLCARNITYRETEGEGEAGFSITYVDLFPAKFMLADGTFTLEYHEPTDETVKKLGIFRHFNKAGLIVNLWNSLVLAQPDGAQVFYNNLETFLRTNGFSAVESAIDEFTEGLDLSTGKLSREEAEKILRDWTFVDVLKLRLVAAAAAFHRKGSRNFLDLIHKNTHFQGEPLPPAQIDAVKDLILQMFDFPVDNGE